VLKNLDLNPSIFFGKVSDIKIKDKLKKFTNDALKKFLKGLFFLDLTSFIIF